MKNLSTYSKKIRYYAVGEYGSRTQRPHYHIILFNVLDADLVYVAWGQGHTMSVPLKNGGTNYVLKYLQKPPQKNLLTLNYKENFLLCQKYRR